MLNSDRDKFDILFKEMNKKLFAFAKSYFVSIWNEPELTEAANDVVQETWIEFLKKYTEKLNDSNECKRLLYTIAKNAALRQKKNGKRELSEAIRGGQNLPENKVENTVFETFENEKMKKILDIMSQNNPRYVFVLKAFMNAGNDMNQVNIVNEIQGEYKQQFKGKNILTVSNFTQILKRAREKFMILWKKYQ